MKVIILTGEPFPNGMAAVNRIKCYARAINEGGVEVEIIIWHRTERYGVKPKNTKGEGVCNGVSFHYIGGTPLRDKSIIQRRINDLRDFVQTKRYLRKKLMQGDVLFLYLHDTNKAISFTNIAHQKGAFCIKDLCELPYGTGKETKKAVFMRKRTLTRLFPRLDGIISISDELLKLAKQFAGPNCQHIKIPIMVDFDLFSINKEDISQDSLYIFHAGTLLQQKDGIIGMIEAFGKAIQHISLPIKYYITGTIEESSHPALIRSLIKTYHLEDRIVFTGYLYPEQIKKYLSSASLVISNRPKSQQDFYGFSTKVGEYLASGTPLITTRWGEAMNWLKDGKTAYIVEPDNTDALSEAIIRAITHPLESKQIGLAGKELCKNSFDYKNWSKPIINFLHHLY